jgi:hypothetical protein
MSDQKALFEKLEFTTLEDVIGGDGSDSSPNGHSANGNVGVTTHGGIEIGVQGSWESHSSDYKNCRDAVLTQPALLSQLASICGQPGKTGTH